ncbi:hypothetical protein [Chitinolyticbacter albus]|uniref:hypothetical protein n=1 Tax=Chitinolyticbacter albus TaxID=2961951 RepID=UPI00210EB574|nr:hypothetical protein [Chitinolyticbacter albus]
MLSQLSDMMYHSATHAGKADTHSAMEPVEIQFGYGIKDGRLDLFASGNTKESQQWLLQQRGKSPHEHIAKAALAENADLAASATKLMFHKENQARRARQIDEAAPPEDRAGLHAGLGTADVIHAKFMTGDYTVVTNTAPGKDPRHAEQNIGEALHQEQYQHGDMDGTKIRCGSCAASLGANLSSPGGTHYSGKFYTSQAAPEHWQTLHGQIASGTHQVVTSLPSRPRANSYPSLPAVSLPVATTSSGEGGTH